MPQTAAKLGTFSYGEYCQWPEGERWELIDGEAFAMSPAPSRLHQEFVVELLRQVATQVRYRGCRVYVAPFDVRLPKGNEADDQIDTVVQPDLAVICASGKLDDKGCRGAPDWVIEILSPFTAGHDQIRKRALYERHGVREYWLLHPTDRLLTIDRLGPDGTYGKPEILDLIGTTVVASVPGLEITWPASDAFDL